MLYWFPTGHSDQCHWEFYRSNTRFTGRGPSDRCQFRPLDTHYYSDGIGIVSVMTDTHITILMALALCQWWQIHVLLLWWHCVSDNRCTYYYSDGIAIVSVMTDTHITILMALALCQWDRYTYYYSDGIDIVSVMTDTHITILKALALCPW